MKKIVAVSMVKNESDIIESFCRYTLTFCDAMLIYEDHSSDSTQDILQSLVSEGLPIFIMDKSGLSNVVGYEQSPITNHMINIAIEYMDADLVLPLDADEFLFALDKSLLNPRDVLESLDENMEYRFKWISHLYNNEQYNCNTLFMPKYFSICESYIKDVYKDTACKSVVSKRLIENKKYLICYGNHALMQKNGKEFNTDFIFDSRLFYAHYPIRSAHQAASKNVILYSNILAMNKNHDMLDKVEKIYEVYKRTKTVTRKDMMGVMYGYMGNANVLDGKTQLMQASFFKNCDITLKYTDYSTIEKNCFYNIMDNFEQLITKLARLAREHAIN